MNRKGFTLVELLATLVILGLIVSIGSVAITKTITKTKEKNYETLVANIKSAVELYYQECKYGANADLPADEKYLPTDCSSKATLKDLVVYGYLNYNGKENPEDKSNNILINPMTEDNITNCSIKYSFDSNSRMKVEYNSGESYCPTTKHYEGDFSDLR